MSDKVDCLRLALDINKLTNNYSIESIVKTAETLYGFVEAKPIDKEKPYQGKFPR